MILNMVLIPFTFYIYPGNGYSPEDYSNYESLLKYYTPGANPEIGSKNFNENTVIGAGICIY